MPTGARRTRRKVRGRDDAEALLGELAASDMDFKAFCRCKGVDGRSLQWWRTHLASPRSEPPVRLAELVSKPPLRTQPVHYRVHVADHVIEVDDAFRDETLARLIVVVSSC